MKKTKKLLSILLAATMTLAMAAPGFAAEGDGESVPATSLTTPTTKPSTADTKGAIAIDNPMMKDDKLSEYTAYKIFDVTYSGSNYAYSIKGDSPWLELFKAAEVGGGPEGADEVEQSGFSVDGLTFVKAASEDVYYVTMEDGFDAATFAGQLYGALAEMDPEPEGTPLTSREGSKGVAAIGLELGYYFVTTNSGALCNLTTTNPNAVIHDKNDAPTIDKELQPGEENSVDVGDTVGFQITGNVPDITGYDAYVYRVTDTMSDGLTFSGLSSVAVTVDGKTYSVADGELELGVEDEDGNVNENGFTLELNLVGKNFRFGSEIKITYSAVVNENAADGVNPETNTANLTYSNDPANSSSTVETPDDVVEVYTSNLVIDKYQTNAENVKLNGAEFVLQNEKDEYYHYENGTVSWVTDLKDATRKETKTETVGEGEAAEEISGYAIFTGLADGKYYLTETKAPTGYNLLADRVEVNILGKSDTAVDDDVDSMAIGGYLLTKIQGIANNTGALLPGTGGIGTTIFYAAGIILMAGAVFFVVRRKRA